MLRSAAESGVLWGRHMRKLTRIPLLLFFSLFQPLLFLVLFSQVFDRVGDLIPQYDNYLQFLAPSIIALTSLNSAFQSGMGMVTDMEDGLLDKFLIAPIRRSSILFGKVFADGSRIMIQALVVIAVAFAMGVRYETGVPGILLMLIIAAAFGIAWAGLSNVIALRTGNGELTMIMGILITFPVLFLSTSFMPSALLPDWLDTVAKFNPITYVVEALRSLTNDGWAWGEIGQAFGIIGLLAALTFTAATRAFFRAIR